MGAFELVTKAWDFMYDNWGLGIQLIKESIGDWKDLGGKLIQGFIDGITGGFTKVIDAVTKLGAVSWKALKAALQIQSPSKVFAELGKAIPDGVEMGINANAPKVQAATEGLAQAPSPTPAQGGAVSGGGKSVTIDVGGITINADSEATAKSIATDIRHELEVVFEQLALQLGAAPT